MRVPLMAREVASCKRSRDKSVRWRVQGATAGRVQAELVMPSSGVVASRSADRGEPLIALPFRVSQLKDSRQPVSQNKEKKNQPIVDSSRIRV